jgi:hypothetical protein
MGAGTLAWACLWLLGQGPGDVVYTNQLAHRVPVQFNRARSEIRELRLYASPNQGRSWDLVDSIQPDKDAFIFRAPGDGTYWLRVASVNHNGEQFPDNPGTGPPNQKMVIDTIKPIMRSLQASRQGNEVVVTWEIQEDNPDAASFRLEYQARDGRSTLWTAIPANAGFAGETRFPVNGSQPLTVRLTLRDLAGNDSFKVVEVPGDSGLAAASFNPMAGPSGATQVGGATPPPTTNVLELSKGVGVPGAGGPGPLPPPGPPITPSPVDPVPPPGNPVKGGTPTGPQPVTPPAREEERQVIASSKWASAPSVAPPVAPTGPQPGLEPKPQPAPTATRPLPTLQYINQPEFTVEYEVSKIGPSGVGAVELYRTRDDGLSWEKYAYDAAVNATTPRGERLQRLVQFHEGEADGIYGFTLVVKNRANIGRRPPQPGEVPELRIELDTTPPIAELYAPTPDPQQGNLMLHWKASDKNLTKGPVNLDWAEKRGGPWQPIGVDLPNSGQYAWKLPERMPVEVFLRLRVRDLAGNETVAITPNALAVDLNEPEGHLLNVSVPPRPR